jgi:hypothetical protein
MAVYAPSGSVEWLHNLPRSSLSGGPSTNIFPSNFDGISDLATIQDGSTDAALYLQGIVRTTAILMIVGGVFIFLLACAYAASCCCSKHCCKGLQDKRDEAKLPKLVVLLFVLLAALSVLAPLLTSVGISSMLKGLDTGNSVGHDIIGVLNDIDSLITTGVDPAGNDINISSEKLAVAIENNADLPPSSKTDLASQAREIGSNAQTMISASTSATGGLTSIKDSLNSILRDENEVSPFESRVGDGSYALGAVTAVFVVAVCVTGLVARQWAKVSFFVSVSFTLLFLFMIWMLTGLILSFGMLSSDACIAPSTTILNALNSSGNSVDVLGGANFYMRCSADPSMAPAGFVQTLEQEGRNAFDAAQQVFNWTAGNLTASLPNEDPAINHAITLISGNISRAESALLDGLLDPSSGVLRCGRIGAIWQKALGAVCTDMIGGGIVVFWGFLLATAIALTLLLAVGVRWGCLHPATMAKDGRGGRKLEYTSPYGTAGSSSGSGGARRVTKGQRPSEVQLLAVGVKN